MPDDDHYIRKGRTYFSAPIPYSLVLTIYHM